MRVCVCACVRARARASTSHLSRETRRTVAHAHALAAAAAARLDHDRVANVAGDANRLVRVGNVGEMAGHRVHARLHRELLRVDLIAQRVHGRGARPDKGDAACLELSDKCRVLREKAVARVHGLRARRLNGREHARDGEVRLGGLGGAQQHRLVRRRHVNARQVGLAVHGHRLDTCAGRDMVCGGGGRVGRRAGGAATLQRRRRRGTSNQACGDACLRSELAASRHPRAPRTKAVCCTANTARNLAAVGDEDLVEQLGAAACRAGRTATRRHARRRSRRTARRSAGEEAAHGATRR